ncbi:hypothetical protein BJ165DRAFT_147141 [Panaeolus papilionaceus]|nr:hypothetical protein BJ165DRAFT_147141 [Panaeolus papilionaceus]
MDVIHVTSMFLAVNIDPVPNERHLIEDMTLVLDQITSRLMYTLTHPLPSFRLLRCAKLYVSRFHPTDWAPLQRQTPVFARSFQVLVHVITLHILEQPDYSSSYLPYHLMTQWDDLCKEVIQTPASQVHRRSTFGLNHRTEYSLNSDVDVAESTYPNIYFVTHASHRPTTNSKLTARTMLPEIVQLQAPCVTHFNSWITPSIRLNSLRILSREGSQARGLLRREF